MQVPNRTTTFGATACLALAFLTGCETAKENKRTTGTAVGAGAGALAGSALAGKGHKTEGAVVGGALGAGGGWLAGDQIDKNDNSNHDKHRTRDNSSQSDNYDSRGSDYNRF
jgi:uncharacterized protein YcfJ